VLCIGGGRGGRDGGERGVSTGKRGDRVERMNGYTDSNAEARKRCKWDGRAP